MRICLVSRELAPFWGAGIGTYASNAAAAWAAAGHEVHLLCPPHAGLTVASPDLPPGAILHTVDPALSPAEVAPRPYEFQRYAMRVRRTLERLHGASPFEFIEFPDYWAEGHEVIRARRAENAFAGAVLCIRLHTPTHECRVLNEETASTTEVLALERAEDLAIRQADLVLSPTRSLLDMVSRRLDLRPGSPPASVIPYPFPVAAPVGPAAASSRPEVLYFGRLERRKGVHLLIQAANTLLRGGANAVFRFIGADTQSAPDGGSMLNHLRSGIPADLASSFIFEPARPRDQLPAAIRAAADSGGVCCFPSLWENFPNACLEAMSLGAPVVASDAGGMAEIIEPGLNGLLFKSGDAGDLAVILTGALGDGAMRARIAGAAPGRIAALCDPAAVVRDCIAAIWSARAAGGSGSRRPLRIALVSREFAPFTGGGIGSHVSQMSAVAAAAGHEVHVLTGPHENLLKNGPYLRPGVHFHAVDVDAGLAALEAYPTFPMRYAMAAHELLTRLSAERPFDYVEFPDYHAEGYFAIRAKRTLGAYADSVLAVRTHSPSWLCRAADRTETLDLEAAQIEHMERASVAEADVVIAPTAAGQQRIALAPRPCASLAHEPVQAIVPCPIDLDELLRELGSSEGPAAASAPETPIVLFFGKFQFLKGAQDLVAAAQILLTRGVNARFRLIGNDSPTGPFGRSMLDFIRSRIEPRFADRIAFEPAIPRRQLAAAIREATASGGLCCFPSHWESFPNVCIEAMALGSPVVGAKVAGLEAIIEHGRSGLHFPIGDSEALAAAVERVLTEPVLRAALSRNGPERIRALCNPPIILGAIERLVRAIAMPQASAAGPAPTEPHLTVIIPFYNLGRYLPETLASLDRQTRRDFRTIIIDDGSTEAESLTILSQIERERPDIRIIHQANRGLAATRNAGLRAATSRWVMPLDADDLIAPTLVEKVLATLERCPELTYVSPMVSYFTEDPERFTGGWVPVGPDRDMLCAQNCAAAASGTVFDRDAALAVGGYDEWLTSYEDWDFWCRLAQAGRRGVVIPEFLLRYRVRAESMYRTEATSRHAALHAHLLSRHPDLAVNPDRAMRMLASQHKTDARALIAQNIRYRVADKVNDALKATGVQRAIKGLTVRVLRNRNRTSRPG